MIGEARHLQAAIRVFELAVALRQLVGAVADLLFELQPMRGGARDAALLRVPDREQHERREHRVAEVGEGREPGRGRHVDRQREVLRAPDAVAVAGAHAEHVLPAGQVGVGGGAALVGAHPVAVEAVELVFVAVRARIGEIERGELQRDDVFLVPELQALDALLGHAGDARAC